MGQVSNSNSFVVIGGNTRCVLGEGPAWVSAAESLYWVDIRGGEIFRSIRDGEAHSMTRSLEMPSAVIPATNDRFVVPAGRGLFMADREFADIVEFARIGDIAESNRCNDAKCDPFGNLWVGTMDSNETLRTGCLWCFNQQGKARLMVEGIGVSNTLAWDVERRRFYFADSMAGDIFVFDYDPAGPSISNQRVFFARQDAPGVPDGSALDEEGFLWNARWGGGRVVRISPDGKLDRSISVGARYPTSCALGGPDMRTLYVTSASLSDSEAPDEVSTAGATFAIDVDVPGVTIPAFGIP